MRTTLDIAEDVLLAVKDRARREKRSAGELLSELAREALTHRIPERSELESFYGFEGSIPLSAVPGAGSEHLVVV